MNFLSENVDDLRELYIDELKKMLSMEQQITDALPKMIEKASDPQLKQAFQSHLQETQQHVTRVEEILRECTGETDTEKCKVLAALVSEAEDTIGDTPEGAVRDAALIAGAQAVEHHEMACYGTARNFARILGESAQEDLLQRTLDEEKHADHLLTQISNRVNPVAQRKAA
ncbi:MAG TPA: ferritin-like domain-containing protein [Acidobacteriaceae bacterium]|nr:ferritin-like domain-containing protein [Acidobacteriaceae bacterium]